MDAARSTSAFVNDCLGMGAVSVPKTLSETCPQNRSQL